MGTLKCTRDGFPIAVFRVHLGKIALHRKLHSLRSNHPINRQVILPCERSLIHLTRRVSYLSYQPRNNWFATAHCNLHTRAYHELPSSIRSPKHGFIVPRSWHMLSSLTKSIECPPLQDWPRKAKEKKITLGMYMQQDTHLSFRKSTETFH